MYISIANFIMKFFIPVVKVIHLTLLISVPFLEQFVLQIVRDYASLLDIRSHHWASEFSKVLTEALCPVLADYDFY